MHPPGQPVAPIALTAAGLSPDRADRATFVARSIARDDFIKNTQIPQLQVAINNVYENSLEAYNSAVHTTADAIAAATSASQAASAATAIQWVSGTTYAVGDARWSPVTKISYRRLIAGAGTTDPSADATNWAAIVMPEAGGGTGSAYPSGFRLRNIDYTLAANALTLRLNPCSLDFRSTTLTTGAPVNVSTAAQLTTTISSGSTGGTISGVQSDIIVLAINNAGTMELAWTNLVGGLNLDETNLINTVAEGGAGAADSANVIYSNTARTGAAYRVVGLIRSTQTTAGTWVQTPTLVQGVGGQALAAMSSIGYGQTPQNVTASRALATTYYNTTGKPMLVSIFWNFNGILQGIISINGANSDNAASTTGNIYATNRAIIPVGASYSFAAAGATIGAWIEMR